MGRFTVAVYLLEFIGYGTVQYIEMFLNREVHQVEYRRVACVLGRTGERVEEEDEYSMNAKAAVGVLRNLPISRIDERKIESTVR